MKRFTLFIISIVLFQGIAFPEGRIAEIWTQPAVFKADEPVSWFFDVTGTDLDGETEGVYLWSWFPAEPDAGNWENSSEFTALTHVEGNIWRMDMTPTDYYGVAAGEITAFYGLLKNKDGSKSTDAFAPDQVPANDIKLYDLSTIEGSALLDYYPKDLTVDRPLSILVNVNNTWSGCETSAVQGDLANASNVHMHSGVNFWDVTVENNADNLAKTELTDIGNGVYRMDLIPQDYYGLTDGYELLNINIVFADDSWTYKGFDEACADFIILAPEAPEVLPPELLFFPQKISKKDILLIKRLNNESSVTDLYYTITAGTVTISGEFKGSLEEMTAYIDLVTPLGNVSDIEKIHVVVTDNNDRTITDTDIHLIQLSN